LQRDLARKQLVLEQIHLIEKVRLEQLKQAPKAGPNLMVLESLIKSFACRASQVFRPRFFPDRTRC
jgi:hypothetical protein